MVSSVVVPRASSWILAAALAFAAPPAIAADTAKWSNGFKFENPEKGYSLTLGGRIMADFAFADTDEVLGDLEDGFEFRRARLFVSGTVYERVEFKAQYDFAGGDADFKDVYVGLLFDWGRLRVGHFNEPFSLEETTSSKYIGFVERSLPVEAFSPSRQSGVGLVGDAGDRFNWATGAYYVADDFGDSLAEDAVDVAGRLGFRPLHDAEADRMLHLGAAVVHRKSDGTLRYRARPEAHLAPRFVDTGSFAGDGALLLGAEVAGVFGPWWLAGEVMRNDVDAPGLGDPTFGGYYAQAGWFLTGESRAWEAGSASFGRTRPRTNFGAGGMGAIEVAARYSHVDLTDGGIAGGEQDDLTLGVNWYLNPVTRVMLDWVHADVEDRGEADFLLMRWQIDF